MNERATAALATIEDHRNVTDLLVRRADEAPEHAAFDVPTSDPVRPWAAVTTAEFLAEVRGVAKGLIAAGLGAGDSVAIMGPSRYAWAVADLAVWFAGGVVVPVYDTASAEQAAAIAADAGVRVGIGGGEREAEMLRDAIGRVRTGLGVWTMDAGERDLAALAAAGSGIADAELERRRTHAGLDDPATIVYTSGTTGEPKGAILTHRNFVGQVRNIAAAYRDVVHEGGNTVIFLPLAHVLARGLQLICLASGMRIAHVSDTAQVVPSLAELRPTFLVVVPRVLERIREAAAKRAAAAHLGPVWRAAMRTAIAIGRAREEGRGPGPGLRIRHAAFDRLFFRRLRALMGRRLAYILSGGGALDPDLSLLFRGLGVPVIEGYGLTETTAPLTGNLPRDIRSGTVGFPLPGSAVRISDAGEILARGVGVFAGYRDRRHTAEAFVDGWFRTGDLGRLDADGRVILEGRLKDVVVTSTGKTVVPHAWEARVASSPLVAHAVVVGEARSSLSALLVLDPDGLAEWSGHAPTAPRTGAVTEVADADLRAHLQPLVDAANARVSGAEQVRRVALVSVDLADPALITPTMKIKRRELLSRAATVVDALYR
ncbi:AMP-binding protein [Microbacterium excoecariae]|uniref:AMP-binding protein n=1 Tax=Microbacterium excoecariae TaxID=2715210 RepID=UPI00140A9030|nr:AMP-binding protein [Microbacterium excoecariae]